MALKLVAASLAVGLVAFWWAASQNSGDKPLSQETTDCTRSALNRGVLDVASECERDTPWYEDRPWLAGLGAGTAAFIIGGILISVTEADRPRKS
jgi:hypothetical protein